MNNGEVRVCYGLYRWDEEMDGWENFTPWGLVKQE
jgi:hypothetical protein